MYVFLTSVCEWAQVAWGSLLFAPPLAALLSRTTAKKEDTATIDSRVLHALQQIANGDWDKKINLPTPDSAPRDVILALELIESVRQSIAERLQRIANAGDSVQRSSFELGRTSQDLYQDIGNFSSVLKTLSDSANQQAQMADDMKLTMLALAKDAAEHQQVALESERTSERIRETVVLGQGEIDEVIKDWETTAAHLRAAGSDIQTFEGTAREIASIVEIISEIAHRTNVLSLNAALEADRSGEAGEAFAVLATEIRGLSDTTRRQATEIGELIADFLKNQSTLLQRLSVGIQELDEGAKAVTTVRAGLGETVKGIELSAKRMAQMARGFEKLAERFAKLQSQAEDVQRLSREHANITQQTVKQTRDRMLVGADQLLHESRNLDRVSADLSGAVQQFRGRRT